MKKVLYPLLLLLISSVLFYCKTTRQPGTQPSAAEVEEALAPPDFSVSPVLSARESLRRMQVEEGFEVKLVASEPLVNTPVALTFDAQGRIWVVEMNGYMQDTLGAGEDIPNGKIVILDDTDHDGVADRRTVFLDSLVLPRAICLIENGLLVGEPTNLWYYEIVNDRPGKRVLVDPAYTEGGNVEHQPNGLLRALDNWIYNAKANKRYRKQGDRWLIERTHSRGQWGISQDDYGRLYYNNNSQNLLGDYFAPGFGATNRNQRGVAGYNEKVVGDNKVYPARPTPGVNRGYMKGTLDDSLRLRNFTAACGPLVYRGDLFPATYRSNVFVAEPSANLIKRNTLDENGYLVQGEQAYAGREFLASTDERFRPVSLYNGPDGALYVVDMYRGIIQHKTYLTPYLKEEIGRRNLTQPLSYGRIYKVVPKGKVPQAVTLPNAPTELVARLGHANGWVRDQAQQMLVDGKYPEAVPLLRQALKETENPLKVLHALWTLEGLSALRTDEVLALLQQPAWPLRMQALSALPSVLSAANHAQYTAALNQLLAQNDTLAAPYVAFLAYSLRSFDEKGADNLLQKLVAKYPNDRYVADAVISNLQDRESTFQNEVLASTPGSNQAFDRRLQQVITYIRNTLANRDPAVLTRAYPKGAAMFSSSCQMCHGADGNGVKALAPPLNKSEWVTGNKETLISVVLFGLTGPVEVGGHRYESPEINGDMPGIGYDKTLPNEDIAELLSFIRKSWQNNASPITKEEVATVRQKLAAREKAFTAEELKK